jgi:hypothetical protein
MEMWSGTETSINDIAPGKNRGLTASISTRSNPVIPEDGNAEQAPATQPEAKPAMPSDQTPPAVPDPLPQVVPEPVPSPPSDQ